MELCILFFTSYIFLLALTFNFLLYFHGFISYHTWWNIKLSYPQKFRKWSKRTSIWIFQLMQLETWLFRNSPWSPPIRCGKFELLFQWHHLTKVPRLLIIRFQHSSLHEHGFSKSNKRHPGQNLKSRIIWTPNMPQWHPYHHYHTHSLFMHKIFSCQFFPKYYSTEILKRESTRFYRFNELILKAPKASKHND